MQIEAMAPARWHAGVAGPSLGMAPFIADALFSTHECDELIAVAEERQFKRARLAGGITQESVRSARACWVDETDFLWLSRRVAEAASEAARTCFPFDFTGFEEGFQLLKYAGDENGKAADFYDWHIDIGTSPLTRTRKLTLVTLLNDPEHYGGGALDINFDGCVSSHRPPRGTCIVFPSFVHHRVQQVVSGTRYSMTAWLHGPTFR